MPYTNLLNQLIQKSGMTAKEVAAKCQAAGANITPSYLSMIRNEKSARIPSDDVSIALAKALGEDENMLVLENIMDTAPEPLRKAIINLYLVMLTVFTKATDAPIYAAQQAALQEAAKQVPLATIVLQMAKEIDFEAYSKQLFQSTVKDDASGITVQMTGIPEFEVPDNAMYPTLQKGDKAKVTMINEYGNGDIVAFTIKDSNLPLQYRQLQKSDDTIWLLAFNSEFFPQRYEKDKMLIVGKVAAVTKLL